MSDNNVAAIAPAEEVKSNQTSEAAPERMAISTMSFLEIVNAIREKYNAKGPIELDSDAPLAHGSIVSFKAKDTGYVLARARVHLMSAPTFDKATGNLFLYLQFIDVSIGPGRVWNITVNGSQ